MAVEVGRACLEKCKSMGYEGALYYGMVKEYADTRGWGVWEVFRELVQNALDEMHEVTGRRPTYYPCRYVPEIDGVLIYDTGRGIATYNLYIGKSEKKHWQRGKFGEGLKVALLTATAIGKKVLVRSGDKEFVPTFARELVEGVPLDVFCICVRRLPTPITGTQVYMYNVGNLCEEFRELIVQGIMERTPDAILVSFESPSPHMVWRDLIDKNVTGGKAYIYVRDIFVSSFEYASGRNACFSYNLYNVQLDESRRIVSISSVESDIGSFLLNMIDSFEPEKVETDAYQKRIKEILKSFLKCVIDDCGKNAMFESEYPPFPASEISYNPARKRKMRLLLDEVIGKDVIIIGDRKMSDLLNYLSIPHIYCTTWFGNNAQHWFDLSEIMKKKAQEMESKIVPRDRINPVLRERLEILERIAWILFEPPSGVRVEYMWAPPEVRGETAGNLIVLNLYHLSSICEKYPDVCMYSFISTFGHELAHIISRAGDLTSDFERALTHLLGHSFNNAIRYHETLKSLVTRFYQTYQ
jgi:hypothetical protein